MSAPLDACTHFAAFSSCTAAPPVCSPLPTPCSFVMHLASLAVEHDTLLKCTLLGGGGSRQRAVVWVSQQERQAIVLLVVLAFFAHSQQLLSLQHPPRQQPRGSAHHLTVGNCWLNQQGCVRPSTASKRERELSTGCVQPAVRSSIDHTAWTETLRGQLAGLSWQQRRERRQLQDRRVKWKRSGGGYIQLSFDLECALAKTAKPDVDGWEVAAPPQPRATRRVELMLHQLILYLKEKYTCECIGSSALG